MAQMTSPDTSHREPEVPPPTARGARGEAENGVDAQSDNASSTGNVAEKAAGPPLTKRQKVRRHCGRFWLWYLIASIIFLAILLPILFKVIIPAIVQAIVKGQSLPILSGRLDVVSGTEMKLALNTSLNTPLPARITDLTLYLYNRDIKPYSPFANLTVGGQKLNGNTKIAIKEQIVTITNQSELLGWLGHVFDQDKVDLSVRGSPTIYLGALKTDTRLDTTVQLPGLQQLSGLGIKDLKVMLPPDKNGKNIKGTINVPNHGVLVLNFGNLTFNILSGDIRIGQITLYDALLNVGNNTLNFDGQLYLDTLIKNIGPVLASQSNALNRGQIDLNVTGNQTVMNGVHITFIENLLASRRLTTSISVITLLSDVLSGIIGGGGGNIIDALGDTFNNNTFIQNIVDHWNTTKAPGKSTDIGSILGKRNDPKEALMWNMLKMGLKMKLNQR
ncbi:hypothetical protein J3459_016301 [Metarhizium acridum]|uniref:Uncharacterized protein n=1 Tax=Metarhizium acridum (strain CQMa 102) TaxID=655827 RepID=E9EFQ0_METAQ|nr:uncharacterized protein MAC_08698 [Metarhizium acridum CQMa 102]EFY85238.1 hypothetical protein MAC_08698 [Metarhizium acridum CQMa 102]KAG8406037.1 hypothetical protein J3458_021378 [Metarhizium acridum]KAG8411804.1 hypothetical protein J3459_016301 [Metarhizium acridum]